jgi:hypothetical protein
VYFNVTANGFAPDGTTPVVINGFMAQTGDVENGNMENNFNLRRAGTGGSAHPDLPAEFSKLPHCRGSIGAAAKEATGRQVEIHEYSAAVSELIRRTDKMRGESDSGPAEPDLLTPGDYEGNIEKWNFGASLRMVTFVPYAPFLEWGWTREDGSGMKAGYHLTGAAQQGKPVIIPAAQKALTASVRGH